MPVIQNPKNVKDKDRCAFGIGVEGNILIPIPENLSALKALGIGYAISIIEKLKGKGYEDFICEYRKKYCIGCGFNKYEGCEVPVELYRKVSVNGIGSRE